MLTLMAMRRAIGLSSLVRKGRWSELYNRTSETPLALTGPSVRHATVGLYGFGPIAEHVVERLLPMQPRRILYKASRPRPFDANFGLTPGRLHDLVTNAYPNTTIANEHDLATLAAESDIFICLCSLTSETFHSIDRKILSKMKKTAVLINVARGGVIDTSALVDALQRDELYCFGADVLEGEPNVSADHPLLSPDLKNKVIIFPHTSSAETEPRMNMIELTARNVLVALGIPAGDNETHFVC